VLPLAAGAALFAFLDPFGTALDVDRLRGALLRRPDRAPTEVLLHFSVSTIARMGGILNAGRGRGGLSIPERKTVARVDAFLGGGWWRAEFDALRDVVPPTSADGTAWADLDDTVPLADSESATMLTATDVAMRIARRFCDELGGQTGYRTVPMPVRPEPGRAPKYVLVLFTRNDHGVWYFADTLGRAGRKWQQAIHDERVRADAAKFAARLGDELSLFGADDLAPTPPPPFDPADYERANRDRWIQTIATNLHRLVVTHGPIRPVDHIEDLYGDVLGQAWETHVRHAVKQLHKHKLILDDGTKEFWRRLIPPNPRHQPPGDRTAGDGPTSEEAS
jgi:hypothetical protein